ncbi:MAG: TolC family protein [Planctomycetota bacterium]
MRRRAVEFDKAKSAIASGIPVAHFEGHLTGFPVNASTAPERDASALQIPGLDVILADAVHRNPLVRAARQRANAARAAYDAADIPDNPEFVIDLDTPVHDQSDATELSTRLTFPIVPRARQDASKRRARARWVRLRAEASAIETRVSRELTQAWLNLHLTAAALRVARDLARTRSQLADYLDPERLDTGDPGRNLIRYVEAGQDATRAAGGAADLDRVLQSDLVRLATRLNRTSESLRQQVIAANASEDGELPKWLTDIPNLPDESRWLAEQWDAAEIKRRQAAIVEQREALIASAKTDLNQEVGPRFQDRLGVNDDTIGVRFSTDVPLHDVNQEQREASLAGLAAASADLENERTEQLANAKSRYAELRELAAQIRGHFVTAANDGVDSRATRNFNERAALEHEAYGRGIEVLENERAEELLSTSQRLTIELALLERKRDRLELLDRYWRSWITTSSN